MSVQAEDVVQALQSPNAVLLAALLAVVLLALGECLLGPSFTAAYIGPSLALQQRGLFATALISDYCSHPSCLAHLPSICCPCSSAAQGVVGRP
jgi:hypothetical protein